MSQSCYGQKNSVIVIVYFNKEGKTMQGQTVRDFVMAMPDVCDLLQRSRTKVYDVMKRYPDFPKPENSGRGKMLIWMKADVLAWYEIHKDELVKDLKRSGRKCAELQK